MEKDESLPVESKQAWSKPEIVDLNSSLENVESSPGPSPDFGGISGS